MSLFPRSLLYHEQSSGPTIFRLLNEIDQYSCGIDRNKRHVTKSFTPKFDVKELSDSFELHGELPGIDRKNIDIEFTDASTLIIKGRIERSYTKVTPPRGFVEGEIDDSTVCGENEFGPIKNDNGVSVKKCKDPDTLGEKFWVMERRVGEFSRSFAFPVAVNQEDVEASMKDGILSIFIPKSKMQENRKIFLQ